MHLRTRVLAATAAATASLVGPAALATSSSSASAANTLCIHLFVGRAGQPGLVDLHIILPTLTIAPGSCPT